MSDELPESTALSEIVHAAELWCKQALAAPWINIGEIWSTPFPYPHHHWGYRIAVSTPDYPLGVWIDIVRAPDGSFAGKLVPEIDGDTRAYIIQTIDQWANLIFAHTLVDIREIAEIPIPYPNDEWGYRMVVATPDYPHGIFVDMVLALDGSLTSKLVPELDEEGIAQVIHAAEQWCKQVLTSSWVTVKGIDGPVLPYANDRWGYRVAVITPGYPRSLCVDIVRAPDGSLACVYVPAVGYT